MSTTYLAEIMGEALAAYTYVSTDELGWTVARTYGGEPCALILSTDGEETLRLTVSDQATTFTFTTPPVPAHQKCSAKAITTAFGIMADAAAKGLVELHAYNTEEGEQA